MRSLFMTDFKKRVVGLKSGQSFAFAVDEMIALLQAKNVIPSFSGANEAVKGP